MPGVFVDVLSGVVDVCDVPAAPPVVGMVVGNISGSVVNALEELA